MRPSICNHSTDGGKINDDHQDRGRAASPSKRKTLSFENVALLARKWSLLDRGNELRKDHDRPCRNIFLTLLFRHRLQRVADQQRSLPVVEKYRAEILVKSNRRGIPVHYLPTHAEVTFLPGDLGHARQQRPSDSLLPQARTHEDVLKKQSCPPLECRVELKIDGIARHLAVPLRDERAKFRMLSEGVASYVFFGHDSFMAHLLIFRQFMDERGKQSGVVAC